MMTNTVNKEVTRMSTQNPMIAACLYEHSSALWWMLPGAQLLHERGISFLYN
jgi:hypothetical protein